MESSSRKGGKMAHAVWFAASLFYFYEYFVRAAPSVMEEELQRFFNVSAAQLATAVGVYYFIYSPMQLIVGTLFDIFGGRRLLLFAGVVVTMGCLLAGSPTHSLALLTFGRLLMGFGSAFGFIGVMFLASQWFEHDRLALLSGLTTTIGLLGGICSQAPMASTVDCIGWQGTWLMTAALGSVVVLMLWLAIPGNNKVPGANKEGMGERQPLSSFFKGLVIILKNPQTWLIGLIAGCLYMPVVVFADLWGVQYVKTVCGIEKTEAANVVAAMYWGWIIGGPIVGWMSDRWHKRKLPMLFGGIACLVLFIVLLLCPGLSPVQLAILLFAIGLVSSAQVICFIASLESNPSHVKGSAMAVVNMIVMLLGGLFQPIFGWILDLCSGAANEPLFAYAAKDYRTALSVMPFMLILGIVACCFMREPTQRS